DSKIHKCPLLWRPTPLFWARQLAILFRLLAIPVWSFLPILGMRAIDHIDPQRCSPHGDQVAMAAFGKGAVGIVKVIQVPIRLDLLAIDEGAVSAAKIMDMHEGWIKLQLTMVARNHFVSLRAGELDEAIQRPADLTTRGPAKAKLAVLMGPRNDCEPDCCGHDTDSFHQGFIGYCCLAKGVPQKGGAKMIGIRGPMAFEDPEGHVRIGHMIRTLWHRTEERSKPISPSPLQPVLPHARANPLPQRVDCRSGRPCLRARCESRRGRACPCFAPAESPRCPRCPCLRCSPDKKHRA